MQACDVAVEEFSVEALETRFEMEALVAPPPETDWRSTCTWASLFEVLE